MKTAERRLRVGIAVGLTVCLLAPVVRGAASENGDREVLRALSRAIARVAAEVRPAVVSVYTTKTVRMRTMPDFPFPFRPPFDDFFGLRRFRGREPKEREFRRTGLGSGFVVDAAKGYVVTNNHVVDGADDIKVRLSDKREFDAKLVGADKKTDLAVIQIKAKGLKALALGDSDKLQVGEFVIAVGSPFGLRETVSTGIVSAKGRSNLGIEDYEDFIQTDAAINVGNSGGPLVNIDGEVVGVNTAILSRSGGSVGVGFAIPINMAKGIIDQLVKSGKVTRGWLGVKIQELTPDVAKRFGLEEAEGALISQVVEGTPADEAGLKTGDVIVKYDGRKIPNVAKLRSRVAATPPGKEAGIVVLRDGKQKTLTARIGRLTEQKLAAAAGTAEEFGFSVQDLTPDIAKTLGVKVKGGAVVTAVDEAGPAAEKGIKRGDVVIEVNRKRVGSAAEFQAALKKANPKNGVLLLVASREGRRFVVVKTDSND